MSALKVVPDTSAMCAEEMELEAKRMEAQAEKMHRELRELRGQIGVIRERARRAREREEANTPKPDPTDELYAAAALATADLEPGFQSHDLAAVLEIPALRATRILLALENGGLVRREGKGAITRWIAMDPEEVRARDAAQALGRFTKAEFADHLGLTLIGADHYVKLLAERGQIEQPGTDGSVAWEWIKPGAERLVTRRRKAPPPEAEVVYKTGDLAPRRGEVVPGTSKPNPRHNTSRTGGRGKGKAGGARKAGRQG
jgi:hypothetical protein